MDRRNEIHGMAQNTTHVLNIPKINTFQEQLDNDSPAELYVCTAPDCGGPAYEENGKCFIHVADYTCRSPKCHQMALTPSSYCPSCTPPAMRPGKTNVNRHLCRAEDGKCQRNARTGGLCMKHGGGKECKAHGCSRNARRQGLCVTHASQKERTDYLEGRAKYPLCTKAACFRKQSKNGMCSQHATNHPCRIEGCTKQSRKGGTCVRHGGGGRCCIDGCNKTARKGGRCIGHGGGVRCTVLGCDKNSLRLGLCSKHGGASHCKIEGCNKQARKGGTCIGHGGGKRCCADGCDKNARTGGVCSYHSKNGIGLVQTDTGQPECLILKEAVNLPQREPFFFQEVEKEDIIYDKENIGFTKKETMYFQQLMANANQVLLRRPEEFHEPAFIQV